VFGLVVVFKSMSRAPFGDLLLDRLRVLDRTRPELALGPLKRRLDWASHAIGAAVVSRCLDGAVHIALAGGTGRSAMAVVIVVV
jgi:hypothetical protein